MTAKINPVKFDIRATDKTKNAFRSVQGNVKRTKTAFASLARAVAPLVAAFGAAQMVRGLVGTNKEFQKLRATLVTFTGSAKNGEKAFKALTRFAASTPFAVKEVTEAYNTLISRGISPSIDQLKVFGDVAAGSGRSLTQFAQAVANATTGEMEMLKQFGITARVESDKLRVSFGGNSKLIERDAKSIVSELENIAKTNFAGATARQAATLDGAFSNLGDSVDMFAFAIGEAGLNKEINKTARSMAAWISANKDVTKQISGALVSGIQALSAGAKFVAENFDLISTAVATFISYQVANVMIGAAVAIGGYTRALILASKAQNILNLITTRMGWGLVLKAAVAIAGGVATYQIFAEKADKATNGLIDAVSDLDGELPSLNKGLKKGAQSSKDLAKAQKEGKAIIEKLLRPTKKYSLEMGKIQGIMKRHGFTIAQFNRASKLTARRYFGISDGARDAAEKVDDLKFAMRQGLIAQDEGTAALRRYELQLVNAQAAQENTFGAGARAGMANYFDELNNKGAQGADFMVNSVFKPMENALTTFYRTGKLDFKSFKDAVLDGLASMAAKATMSFAGAAASSFGASAGSAAGSVLASAGSSALKYVSSFFASGGSVSGPGTGTSDSIPAMLSNGEYVINADAASKIGVGNLNALNSGRIRGFAAGGNVSEAEREFEGAQGRFGGVSVSESSQGVGPGLGNSIAGGTVFGKVVPSQLQQIQNLVESLPKGTQAHKNALATQAELQGSFFAMGLPNPMSKVVSIMSQVVAAALRSGMDVDFVGGPDTPGGADQDSFVKKMKGNGAALAGEMQGMMGGAVGGLGGKFNDNMLNLVSKVDAMRSQPIPRADGGPMLPGKPYRVGERGTEVITPGAAGIVQQTPSSDPTGSKSIVHEIRELRGEMSALTRTISRLVAGQPNAGMRFA